MTSPDIVDKLPAEAGGPLFGRCCHRIFGRIFSLHFEKIYIINKTQEDDVEFDERLRIQFTGDLRIHRLLNGMWQVSGAHGKPVSGAPGLVIDLRHIV